MDDLLLDVQTMQNLGISVEEEIDKYEDIDFDIDDFDIESDEESRAVESDEESKEVESDEESRAVESDTVQDQLNSVVEDINKRIESGKEVDNVCKDLRDLGNISTEEPVEVKKLSFFKRRKAEKMKKKQRKLDKIKQEKKDKKIKKLIESGEKVEPEVIDKAGKVSMHDTSLYVITDKNDNDLMEYMNECGIHSTVVTKSIVDIKNILMVQRKNVRVVIIDSGCGMFSSIVNRNEFINMLGMADVDVKFSVYYTDTAIKSSTETAVKSNKFIKWHMYNTTADVIVDLMGMTENYKVDDKYFVDSTVVRVSDNIYGKNIDTKSDSLSAPTISAAIINEKVNNEELAGIREFEIDL